MEIEQFRRLNFDPVDAEFAAVESHLRQIDGRLLEFCVTVGGQLSGNAHEFPERSIKWNNNEIDEIIQIFYCGQGLDFSVWVCQRNQRTNSALDHILADSVSLEIIEPKLSSMLENALQLLHVWKNR